MLQPFFPISQRIWSYKKIAQKLWALESILPKDICLLNVENYFSYIFETIIRHCSENGKYNCIFFIDNIWESITNLQLLIYVGVVSQSIISLEYS